MPIAIVMVHNLMRKQFAAKHFFHHDTMFVATATFHIGMLFASASYLLGVERSGDLHFMKPRTGFVKFRRASVPAKCPLIALFVWNDKAHRAVLADMLNLRAATLFHLKFSERISKIRMTGFPCV